MPAPGQPFLGRATATDRCRSGSALRRGLRAWQVAVCTVSLFRELVIGQPSAARQFHLNLVPHGISNMLSRVCTAGWRQASRLGGAASTASQQQQRAAHVQVPDWSSYKRESAKVKTEDGDASRRAFTYVMGAGGAIAGAHMAKNMVQDFLMTMSASVSLPLRSSCLLSSSLLGSFPAFCADLGRCVFAAALACCCSSCGCSGRLFGPSTLPCALVTAWD